MNKFASKFKQIREKLGLSQKEIADILGVSQKSVSYWEQGRNEPQASIVRTFCNKFGINPNWLLMDKGEMFLKDNPKIAGIVNSEIQNAAIAGNNGLAVVGNNITGNNNTITSNLSDEDKMIQELITAFKKLPKRLQRGYYFKILGEAELYSEDEYNDRN